MLKTEDLSENALKVCVFNRDHKGKCKALRERGKTYHPVARIAYKSIIHSFIGKNNGKRCSISNHLNNLFYVFML